MFEVLKKRFTIKLILVAPNLDKKMRMKVDVLDYVIEEILSMECEDGR